MVKPALSIGLLLQSPEAFETCRSWLPANRYQPIDLPLEGGGDLLKTLESQRELLDAIVVDQSLFDPQNREALQQQGLVFPAVVVGALKGKIDYHAEEVHLPVDQLEQLGYSVDAAISRFLRHHFKDGQEREQSSLENHADANSHEVWRLQSRLQERLGCLGVFYKRDPSRFLRNLPSDEQKELLQSLQRTYRNLLSSYFRDPGAANQALESFVNTAFFGDLPITRAVEIHMNLMDGFLQQLKLAGKEDDFLQDYRLALLDVMAHLCEMYRRSVPADQPIQATEISSYSEQKSELLS
ncbi:MAG: circadian clock protein KaiA [Prochlorococcus sp.]|jgi:circadian clock protein KaiA|nr:circadian clock protein KaiA [Prochlorococcus sp.]CAI8167276.1 MAG: Circadian clock protein KaiA [Prochlorococcus marinus str. MIT 9215]